MSKIKVYIGGSLVVHKEDAISMPSVQYIYDTKSGDSVSSIRIVKTKLGTFVKYPRCMEKFERFCASEKDIEYIDRRVTKELDGFSLSKSFKLRDYQEKPVKELVETLKTSREHSCILQAAPGFGKTYILPKIVKELGQKTLILVDRDLLRDQMYTEFVSNSDAKVVKLTSETKELGDVTISTFQMLLAHPAITKKLATQFGLVVVDECHVAPAAKFLDILSSFPAKYRIGLSATPTRSDGLSQIITDVFSYNKVIGDNPNNLKISNVVVDTKIPVYFSGTSNYAKNFVTAMISPIDGEDTPITLAAKAADKLIQKGRRVLLYTTYSKLQDILKQHLEDMGYTVGVIYSKTTKKVRQELIEKFQKNELDFLISGVILQKGVSIHALDTIINLAPQNKENLEQVKGRLRRELKDKKPPLFVYFTYSGNLEYGTAETINNLKSSTKTGDKFILMSVQKFKERLQI
jgi:superfamily II DNA or RNA helicase